MTPTLESMPPQPWMDNISTSYCKWTLLSLPPSLPSLRELSSLSRSDFKHLCSLEVSAPRSSPPFQCRWLLVQRVSGCPFFRDLFLLHWAGRPDRYCIAAAPAVQTSSGWNAFSQNHVALCVALSSCPFKKCSIPNACLFFPLLCVPSLPHVHTFLDSIHPSCTWKQMTSVVQLPSIGNFELVCSSIYPFCSLGRQGFLDENSSMLWLVFRIAVFLLCIHRDCFFRPALARNSQFFPSWTRLSPWRLLVLEHVVC